MTKSTLAKFLVIMASSYLLFGFAVAAFFLREPDTCFLLATGRWIFEHQALPVVDPFSYTCAQYPQDLGLVVYQWLSTLIFFIIYKLGGTAGLAAFACIVLVCSFFIIPWLILNSFALGPLRASMILVCLALGTVDRLLLKPEIFSYLFLSLFILAAVKSETSNHSPFIDWKQISFLAVMLLFWANLHTGFVIGIVFILLLALRDLLLWFYNKCLKKTNCNYSPSWLIAFVVCLSTSFLTPYGIKLWQYIPHLYFHPVNQYIGELRPLSLAMMLHNFPLLISFAALLILALIEILRKLRQGLSKSDLFYFIIAIVGIFLAICCMRMVTFAFLLMLPLIASGFRVKDESSDLDKIAVVKMPALVLSFSLIGCLTMSLLSSPTIPVKTASFSPPFSALKYIAEHNLSGNLLNEPGFGDFLIWNMRQPPRVFIDTRFDAYPWPVTQDFLALRDCKSGWQDLLEKYHIGWIFIPPNIKLSTELNKDKNWHTVFQDQSSQILVTNKKTL